jgi:hypothetical protein
MTIASLSSTTVAEALIPIGFLHSGCLPYGRNILHNSDYFQVGGDLTVFSSLF